MSNFSKNYKSFSEWLTDQVADTDYKRRIIRLHAQHSGATLAQLRGHAVGRERPLSSMEALPKAKRSWSLLKPSEKEARRKSLTVLSQVRRNKKSLTMASKDANIPVRTVLKNTNAFKKVGSRWVAERYDKIPKS